MWLMFKRIDLDNDGCIDLEKFFSDNYIKHIKNVENLQLISLQENKEITSIGVECLHNIQFEN